MRRPQIGKFISTSQAVWLQKVSKISIHDLVIVVILESALPWETRDISVPDISCPCLALIGIVP